MGIMWNNTFTSKQFNVFSIKLKEQFRCVYGASQIKAKFARLNGKTNIFHKLINTIGFGWNLETNIVTVEKDVWSTY